MPSHLAQMCFVLNHRIVSDSHFPMECSHMALDQPTERPARPARYLRFAAFRSAAAKAVVAFDVRTDRPDDFQGTLSGRASGDVQLLAIAGDAHSVHRTPALISKNPQHYVKFTVLEQGSGTITQDGSESRLSAGDMTVSDTGRPYSLVCGDDTRFSVVMFPKRMLALPGPVIARAAATPLDSASGIGAMVRPYISSLAQQAGDFEPHTLHRLSQNALALVSTLLESHGGSQVVAGAQETLLHRVLQYVDAHLSEPELSPGMIAAAHFVSVRYLHLLFSDRGTTVSTVIRNRRLERCYDELLNPLRAERSVSSIALDNGFVDPAHFSRTFRAHFGIAPSSLRRRRS